MPVCPPAGFNVSYLWQSCQLASMQVAARRLTSVEMLLQCGASLYSLDVNGWTPGHYICCHPFNSRWQLLLVCVCSTA